NERRKSRFEPNRMDHLGKVNRFSVCALVDLFAAAEPVGDDQRIVFGFANSRKQRSLARFDRHVILLAARNLPVVGSIDRSARLPESKRRLPAMDCRRSTASHALSRSGMPISRRKLDGIGFLKLQSEPWARAIGTQCAIHRLENSVEEHFFRTNVI